MYVCMYIYIYMYILMCMHTYIYIYIYVHISALEALVTGAKGAIVGAATIT